MRQGYQRKRKGDNIKIKSIQKWLPFENVLDDGLILLKDKTTIKILKIFPINFNLKSDFEKEAILSSYKFFLQTCNFDFQVLIQNNKQELLNNIQYLKNNQKNNSWKINSIIDEYCCYIQKLNKNNKSSKKIFYILIQYLPEKKFYVQDATDYLNNEYIKIKESLSRCGNYVEEVNTKEETKKILRKFLNMKYYLK